jgi:hypothetical protein
MLVAALVLYVIDTVRFYGNYFGAARALALRLWQHFVG